MNLLHFLHSTLLLSITQSPLKKLLGYGFNFCLTLMLTSLSWTYGIAPEFIWACIPSLFLQIVSTINIQKIFIESQKGTINIQRCFSEGLRARRALSISKDVSLRTRRALLLYNVYGDSARLVLSRTSLNSDSALLALNWRNITSQQKLKYLYWWSCAHFFFMMKFAKILLQYETKRFFKT